MIEDFIGTVGDTYENLGGIFYYFSEYPSVIHSMDRIMFG